MSNEQTRAVFDAIQTDDFDQVQAYLECGGDPNAKEKRTGNLLLCQAAQNDRLRIGELLLEHGAEPNLASHAWPIHFAAGSGHVEFVELLIQAGSEVHCLDEDGSTPLADAAAGGHLKLVELLLEAGADPNYKDRYGKRPILYAAEKGHSEVVEVLAPYSSANELKIATLRLKFSGSEEIDEDFMELDNAANQGELNPIKKYLEHGGNPNAFSLGGRTLLMTAANRGRIEVLRCLLDNGADPNQLNENGGYALEYSLNAKSSEAYDLLSPITEEKLRKRAERYKEQKQKAGYLDW